MSSIKSAQDPGESLSRNGNVQKRFRGSSMLLLPPLSQTSQLSSATAREIFLSTGIPKKAPP